MVSQKEGTSRLDSPLPGKSVSDDLPNLHWRAADFSGARQDKTFSPDPIIIAHISVIDKFMYVPFWRREVLMRHGSGGEAVRADTKRPRN